jgi:hypothetical protein
MQTQRIDRNIRHACTFEAYAASDDTQCFQNDINRTLSSLIVSIRCMQLHCLYSFRWGLADINSSSSNNTSYTASSHADSTMSIAARQQQAALLSAAESRRQSSNWSLSSSNHSGTQPYGISDARLIQQQPDHYNMPVRQQQHQQVSRSVSRQQQQQQQYASTQQQQQFQQYQLQQQEAAAIAAQQQQQQQQV